MIRRTLAAAAVGLTALLAAPGDARAGDTIRLGGSNVDAPVQTLGFDGDAGVDLMSRRWGGAVAWGGGGGRGFVAWGGGHRGWGGWGGGWNRGWHGHGHWHGGWNRGWNVGWGGGWNRGWGHVGWGRPWGGWNVGWGRPWGWGGWNGGWGGSVVISTGYPVYYSSPVYYTYPCANGYGNGSAVTLGATQQYYTPQYQPQQGNGEYLPPPNKVPPMPPPQDGTFPYNGGPTAPVPMPKDGQQPAPMKVQPQQKQPGLLVSYPPQPVQQPRPALAYPAYGEDTRATGFATTAQPRPKTTSFGTGGR